MWPDGTNPALVLYESTLPSPPPLTKPFFLKSSTLSCAARDAVKRSDGKKATAQVAGDGSSLQSSAQKQAATASLSCCRRSSFVRRSSESAAWVGSGEGSSCSVLAMLLAGVVLACQFQWRMNPLVDPLPAGLRARAAS